MAYQPPRKSTYGDELSDDNWPQQTDAYGGYSDSGFRGQSYQPLTPSGIAPPPPLPGIGQSNSSPLNQSKQVDSALNASMTPEDLLLIRQWQRDSFLYRVLPLTSAGTGLMYFYNVKNQLPHKISRYSILMVGTFLLGKISYQGELRKRIAETRLNTPFIQACRKSFGIQNVALPNDFGGGAGSIISDGSDLSYSFGNTQLNTSYPMTNQGFGYNQTLPNASKSEFNQQQTAFGSSTPSSQYSLDNPPGSIADPSLKPVGTSYEELRARNRGIIR